MQHHLTSVHKFACEIRKMADICKCGMLNEDTEHCTLIGGNSLSTLRQWRRKIERHLWPVVGASGPYYIDGLEVTTLPSSRWGGETPPREPTPDGLLDGWNLAAYLETLPEEDKADAEWTNRNIEIRRHLLSTKPPVAPELSSDELSRVVGVSRSDNSFLFVQAMTRYIIRRETWRMDRFDRRKPHQAAAVSKTSSTFTTRDRNRWNSKSSKKSRNRWNKVWPQASRNKLTGSRHVKARGEHRHGATFNCVAQNTKCYLMIQRSKKKVICINSQSKMARGAREG